MPAFVLSALGFLLLAFGAGWWLRARSGSLLNFRSPLRAVSLPPVSLVGPAQTRRLVIIVIDGLRYDTSLKQDVMPALAALRAQGAYAEMTSFPPTPSQTGYTTLLTGAQPEISGAHLFNAPYDKIRPVEVETLFAAAHRAGLRTAISAYYFFEKLIPPDERDSSFFTPGEDHVADEEVMEAALPWLEAGDQALVWIHLDQVDYAGDHEGGPLNPSWNEAAARADAMVTRVLERLDLAHDTLLVVSDHGQIDRGGHGGHEILARREPFIAAGAGIRPGDCGQVEMIDVAPTAAALLGVGIPSAAQGRVLPILNNPPNTEILAAQQTALGRAYLQAISADRAESFSADLVDPVSHTQKAMMQARSHRLRRERLPRFIFVLFGLAALAWMWIGTRGFGDAVWPALAGAAAYLLVFHGLFAVIQRRPYSFSIVGGAKNILSAIALDTLAGFGAGAALALWLAGKTGLELAHSLNAFVAVTAFLVGLPSVFSFIEGGLTAKWTVPDWFLQFLWFISVLQLLMLSGLGAALLPVLGKS
jgi:hypothetical protein